MVENTLIVATGDVCHHRVKCVHILVLYSKMYYCFWKSNSVLMTVKTCQESLKVRLCYMISNLRVFGVW